MSIASRERPAPASDAPPEHTPYVPADAHMDELTWQAVAAGAILGIIFGASSLYLVLKVGMTVSASIPVAVLSITLFRLVGRATILENNIVQTTGSAGESIAFGVGVTLPALMLLGFEMQITRVMTVGVLGGLLGILMMIPLRRAFIVKQHGVLPFPEGTACADVLIVGEKGGATAFTVFLGFGVAFLHKFAMKGLALFKETVGYELRFGQQGLPKGIIGGELTPELLGVGYIIGPKIASITFAGGVLAYLVLVPMIVMFGQNLKAPLAPETVKPIAEMNVSDIRNSYILYIGAGAVATGGIISMLQAMPLIGAALWAGIKDLSGTRGQNGDDSTPRTQRDMPMGVVAFGSIALVVALAALPNLGLGFTFKGLVASIAIVGFGFLFVTVSSRLTGLIGSSSNPISGMTVATLLLTCLIFLSLGMTSKADTLTALTVAAVVCVAASNGGTTAQDLKTGFLVGATPRNQQWAILIGALTSALAIGATLLLLNHAFTHTTNQAGRLPNFHVNEDLLQTLTEKERAGYPHQDDPHEYHVLHVADGEIAGLLQGKYLVDDEGTIRYLVDPGIGRRYTLDDVQAQKPEGERVEATRFEAPKTRLMALIIDGILNQKLPWSFVLLGALIALTLELAGVPSLPFAVGVYLPIETSLPIFIGGAVRWAMDPLRPPSRATDADSSPAVLLSSGYIAGGAIAGVLIAMLNLAPPAVLEGLNLGRWLPTRWQLSDLPSLAGFALLVILLVLVDLGMVFAKKEAEAPPP